MAWAIIMAKAIQLFVVEHDWRSSKATPRVLQTPAVLQHYIPLHSSSPFSQCLNASLSEFTALSRVSISGAGICHIHSQTKTLIRQQVLYKIQSSKLWPDRLCRKYTKRQSESTISVFSDVISWMLIGSGGRGSPRLRRCFAEASQGPQ